MNRARIVAALILVWLAFSASPARAEAQRFAVIIGNNTGDADEQTLHYAESDAERMSTVLRELGGFKPADMVLLQGQSARTVEETLIAYNERVRTVVGHEGNQALLVVYYSGHADGDALHLGGTRLSLRLLSQLVGGSAATFRLLMLDACRAGVLTRSKGGRMVKGVPLASESVLPGHGLAVLAASASHEDAQESDEIRGSYFTHALVSGLMGAADQDGDGSISLGEAYQYAYAATLRATSRTRFGSQHPTFRFEMSGQGAVVLTQPEGYAERRARLEFPHGTGFLILRDDAGGAVVGEVGPHDLRRALSVRPGKYFVRGRGADVLYEGAVTATPGENTRVALDQLKRIEYARLVRKGGSPDVRDTAHSLEAGSALRSALVNADTPCIGGYLAYGLERPHVGLQLRGSACTASFGREGLQATVNEYDFDVRVDHSWDFSFVTMRAGLGAGAALFTQRFEGNRLAPARNSASPYLSVQAGLVISLGRPALVLDVCGETHLLRMMDGSAFTPALALRASAGVALPF